MPLTSRPVTKVSTMLLVVALVVRAGVSWLDFEALESDPDSYALLAKNLAAAGTFGFIDEPDGAIRATAYRPPLYPWLLSSFVLNGQLSLALVAILHVLLGVITVLLTFFIALRLNLRLAWLPALAVAIDPILLRSSQLVMTETLAVFLLTLAWFLWVTNRHLSARSFNETSIARKAKLRIGGMRLASVLGLVLGLSILARPTSVAWMGLSGVFFILYLWWTNKSISSSLNLKTLKIGVSAGWLVRLGLGIAVVLVPWIVRNYLQLGHPIWATTHGGYTLLLANNPRLFEHFEQSGPSRGWDAEPFHRAWAARLPPHTNESETMSGLTPADREFWYSDVSHDQSTPLPTSPEQFIPELDDNALAYEAAWATIRSEPMQFLRASVYRAGWFWAAWPYSKTPSKTTYAIGLWYVTWFAIFATGCVLLLKRGDEVTRIEWLNWMPAVSLILALTLVHSIYWGNMRMRGQLMPAVYMVSALVFQRKATGLKTTESES